MALTSQRSENGIEQPFSQYSWHDIAFTGLDVEISRQDIASADFYQAFYRQFFATYRQFSELSPTWRQIKTETASALSALIPARARVLSYGCGIGMVEKALAGIRPDIALTAYDFADTASRWIYQGDHGFRFVTTLEGSGEFDVIYLCQVTYALDNKECGELLSLLRRQLAPGGRIILVNTSPLSHENGDFGSSSAFRKLIQASKNLLRPAYLCILEKSGRRKYQFWGWLRDNACMTAIARAAGFRVNELHAWAHQSLIVLLDENYDHQA